LTAKWSSVAVGHFPPVKYNCLFQSEMSKVKKTGKKFVASRTTNMDEEEFAETGGIVGYIERAKSLYLRKKIKPAMTYVI
jgi:hypothetical protein